MKMRLVAAILPLICTGCERKHTAQSNPLSPPQTIHTGQSILVMGQSNALMMAQSQPTLLLANAQTAYPGVDHIVQCAVVGSGELTWAPGSANYQACLQKVRSDGRHVAFIIWWQGESEAGPPAIGQSDPAMWGQIFVSLMNQFRQAIGRPDLEVLYARLGDDPRAVDYHSWAVIRNQQTNVVLPHGSMVNLDGIPINAFPHYDDAGYLSCSQQFTPKG